MAGVNQIIKDKSILGQCWLLSPIGKRSSQSRTAPSEWGQGGRVAKVVRRRKPWVPQALPGHPGTSSAQHHHQ